MDRVPTIGGARGIFEIFVPGLFLVLNAVGAVYLYPAGDLEDLTSVMVSNTVLVLLVAVPFAYFAGVVLRLFRADVPDKASAWFLRLYDANARGGEREDNCYAYASFPYTRWLTVLVARCLPEPANDFFVQVWLRRPFKQFLNFCKVVVTSEDPSAAAEIYSAEALSRYISGMFYALFGALAMVVVDILARILVGVPVGRVLPVLAVGYGIGVLAILANFRFIRIKEVEVIFAASFKNRHLFSAPAK